MTGTARATKAPGAVIALLGAESTGKTTLARELHRALQAQGHHVALVEEARCIGCTRCIDACPVDAIVGAQGLMHTVVESWCIGCRLCVPPCPVDCIEMIPVADDATPWRLRRPSVIALPITGRR